MGIRGVTNNRTKLCINTPQNNIKKPQMALKLPRNFQTPQTAWFSKTEIPLPDSWSNWNLEVLVFEERGKLENARKNLSEQGRKPTANSTHIWPQCRDLIIDFYRFYLASLLLVSGLGILHSSHTWSTDVCLIHICLISFSFF